MASTAITRPMDVVVKSIECNNVMVLDRNNGLHTSSALIDHELIVGIGGNIKCSTTNIDFSNSIINFAGSAINNFTGNVIFENVSSNSFVGEIYVGNIINASDVAAQTFSIASDFIGSITLAAGFASVPNTSISASDKIMVTRSGLGASTALGFISTAINPGIDFTITSYQSDAATIEANDFSIVDYVIIRSI